MLYASWNKRNNRNPTKETENHRWQTATKHGCNKQNHTVFLGTEQHDGGWHTLIEGTWWHMLCTSWGSPYSRTILAPPGLWDTSAFAATCLCAWQLENRETQEKTVEVSSKLIANAQPQRSEHCLNPIKHSTIIKREHRYKKSLGDKGEGDKRATNGVRKREVIALKPFPDLACDTNSTAAWCELCGLARSFLWIYDMSESWKLSFCDMKTRQRRTRASHCLLTNRIQGCLSRNHILFRRLVNNSLINHWSKIFSNKTAKLANIGLFGGHDFGEDWRKWIGKE